MLLGGGGVGSELAGVAAKGPPPLGGSPKVDPAAGLE